MGAKGCNGRGGNANGKKYEARRHGGNGGGKGARRRASASRVEKAHETVERRAGKAAIAEALEDDAPLSTFATTKDALAAVLALSMQSLRDDATKEGE
jgi:hypothetical protein